MGNVLLGATGSVAAVRVPALFGALTAAGHAVRVVATDAATYFFDPAGVGNLSPGPSPGKGGEQAGGSVSRDPEPAEGRAAGHNLTPPPPSRSGKGEPKGGNLGERRETSPLLLPSPLRGGAGGEVPAPARLRGLRVAANPLGPPARDPRVVTLDADEWPGRADGRRYDRGDEVVHIELRTWADLFLIAPLDANTLAKLAVGLCDNCLTCVWRAWDTTRPVVLAPAMNTRMWQHAFTRRHLRGLAADAGAAHVPGHLDGAALIAQINDRARTLRIVPPVEKALACGDVGVGGLADTPDIVAAVAAMLARAASPPAS